MQLRKLANYLGAIRYAASTILDAPDQSSCNPAHKLSLARGICRIRIDQPHEISIELGMRVYREGCCAKLNPTGFTDKADQATKP